MINSYVRIVIIVLFDFCRCIDDEYINNTEDSANSTYGQNCFYTLPGGIEKQCSSFEYDKSIFEETVVTKVNQKTLNITSLFPKHQVYRHRQHF